MGLNLVKKTYVKKDFGEHLTVILKEMCSRVGADYDKMPMQDKEQQWYYRYSWTEDDEIKFIEWLTNYLYASIKARRELMTITSKNKKRCKEVAQFFVFNYGWKRMARLAEQR